VAAARTVKRHDRGRRLSKAEALDQFRQNPELASTVSGAARRWGCSRSTARQWIAEFTAPPVATVSPPPDAIATTAAATDAAMAAPPSPAEAVKAAPSALCDALESITPEQLVDSCDDVEILGLHGDAQLAAAWLGAVEVLAAGKVGR
jgi:transposase-like protein